MHDTHDEFKSSSNSRTDEQKLCCVQLSATKNAVGTSKEWPDPAWCGLGAHRERTMPVMPVLPDKAKLHT